MPQPQEVISFHKGNCNTNKAKSTLVAISLESALLGHNTGTYEMVVEILKEKYGCTLADCYKHPEYLNKTLRMIPEDSRASVVESVRRTLEEFSYIKSISKFVDIMSK